MTRSLTINGRTIDDDSAPYLIAEIGHNHQGDPTLAHELVRQAAECGATAVKFQKRENETLFTREMFNRPYEGKNSYGRTYGLHRMALELDDVELAELQRHAGSLGIDYFSTPFDIPSAELLNDAGVPCFKIASADITNTPLLRRVASFGKPVLISTGGADIIDVDRAVRTVLPINPQLCVMQCTAAYPAHERILNLRVISTYRERYPDVVIGYSGHDDGIRAAAAAYLLGARVIEKHFTLSHAARGTDHAFSLEPAQFAHMVSLLGETQRMMGSGVKRVLDVETEPIAKMGKSLYARRPLPAGHVLDASDIVICSPGGGLPPYELENVVGCRLTQPLDFEQRISVEHLGEQVLPQVLVS